MNKDSLAIVQFVERHKNGLTQRQIRNGCRFARKHNSKRLKHILSSLVNQEYLKRIGVKNSSGRHVVKYYFVQSVPLEKVNRSEGQAKAKAEKERRYIKASLDIISFCGSVGATKRDIARRTRYASLLSSREQENILYKLYLKGKIKKLNKLVRGKPVVRYILPCYQQLP